MDEYVAEVSGIKGIRYRIEHLNLNDQKICERIILGCIKTGHCSLLNEILWTNLYLMCKYATEVLTSRINFVPPKPEKIADVIRQAFSFLSWVQWTSRDITFIIRALPRYMSWEYDSKNECGKQNYENNIKILTFLGSILKFTKYRNSLHDMEFGDNAYYKYTLKKHKIK